MFNFVFVIDTDKRPQDPVHPAKARLLLGLGVGEDSLSPTPTHSASIMIFDTYSYL
jgi:hypothetical protein